MYKVSVDFLTGSTLSFLSPFLLGGGGGELEGLVGAGRYDCVYHVTS